MPTKSYTLGPGTLELGEPGDVRAIEEQVVGCTISWAESTTAGERIPLLSGGELRDDDQTTYAATIAGNVVQDGDLQGLVAWSWANKGQVVPFKFTPSTALGVAASGSCRIVPLDFGGNEAKKRPTSDFSWACPGEPALGEA